MKTVHFASSNCGYVVQVCENGEVIHEYNAGNHAKVSDVCVQPGSKWAETPEKLAKMASRTAMDLAAEYGVDKKNVEYDADLEAELQQFNHEMTTMVVLNDEETFTGTQGCVVCEYNEVELCGDSPDSLGAADVAVDLIKNGNVSGRVLSIEALVNLYDTVMAQSARHFPIHASIIEAAEKVNLSAAEHTS